MNNIRCLDYESEAEYEDRVCSGMIYFKMTVVGRRKGRERKKMPQKFYIIVISICFSYSKCLFRG